MHHKSDNAPQNNAGLASQPDPRFTDP